MLASLDSIVVRIRKDTMCKMLMQSLTYSKCLIGTDDRMNDQVDKQMEECISSTYNFKKTSNIPR